MQLLRIETDLGEIIAYEIFGPRYFKAVEIATMLGFAKPRDAVNRFCTDVEFKEIPTNGGWQVTKMIQKKDFYRLVMHCNTEIAEAIKEDWIDDIMDYPKLVLQQTKVLEESISDKTQIKKALERENSHLRELRRLWDSVSKIQDVLIELRNSTD